MNFSSIMKIVQEGIMVMRDLFSSLYDAGSVFGASFFSALAKVVQSGVVSAADALSFGLSTAYAFVVSGVSFTGKAVFAGIEAVGNFLSLGYLSAVAFITSFDVSTVSFVQGISKIAKATFDVMQAFFSALAKVAQAGVGSVSDGVYSGYETISSITGSFAASIASVMSGFSNTFSSAPSSWKEAIAPLDVSLVTPLSSFADSSLAMVAVAVAIAGGVFASLLTLFHKSRGNYAPMAFRFASIAIVIGAGILGYYWRALDDDTDVLATVTRTRGHVLGESDTNTLPPNVPPSSGISTSTLWIGESSDVKENTSGDATVSTGVSAIDILATTDFTEVYRGKNVIKSVKYKSGDIVLKNNHLLRIIPGSINADKIAWHGIDTSNIDTGSVTSRTIADHTIKNRDLDNEMDLEVNSLTTTEGVSVGGNLAVTGTFTIAQSATSESGLTVSGGNVLFSTAGSINQTGTGQVTFAGNVDANGGVDTTTLTTSGLATLNSLLVSTNATISGTLGVSGDSALEDLAVSGNTTLGDASTDTLIVNAQLASHLVPSTNNVYDLGSTTNYFRSAYISNLATSGGSTISGDLIVDGNTTLGNALSDTVTVTGSSITFSGFTSNGGPLYTNGSGVVAQTTAGTSTQVLHGGATPTFGAVVLTTDISGVLPVANGGTNIASYTVGDLIYASGTTTLSKLADVATGSVLISGGVGVAPSWGTIGASGITADSLNFTEFADALTLDASTDISITGSNVFSLTNTGTGNSFLVNDAAGDTTPFVIDASGNVGIGTSTLGTGALLTANGRAVLGSNNQYGSVGTVQIVGSAPSLAFHYPSNTIGYIQFDKQDTSHNNFKFRASVPGSDGYAGIDVEGPSYLATASGNVGIGTTSPGAKLVVSRAASASNAFDEVLRVAQTGGTNSLAGPGIFFYGGTNNQAFGAIGGSNGSDGLGTQSASLRFQTANGGTLSDKMTISPAGNVGIGDTTPSALLTVGSGDLFQVNSSGAIAAATGITSSGTITLSGFTSNGGPLYTNGSGVVAQTTAGTSTQVLHGGTTPTFGAVVLTTDISGTLPIANGGTNATTIGSAGSIPYSTGSAYAFSAVGTAGQALVSGGSGAPTFFAPTLGSVLFATTSGALAQDNANFFWDDTNNRLGIGDTTPDNQLDLLSSAAVHNGLVITNTNAGSYNPNIQFELTENTPLFTFGIDDSDSDMFKISTGSDITSTNQFTIDSSGVTSIANLSVGAQSFESDPGILTWIDMPVTSSATIGTVESYTAQLDGNAMITVYGESDGAGSIQNARVGVGTTTPSGRLHAQESGAKTTASYNGYFENLATNTTTDAINKYGAYVTSTGSFTGAGGAATNNYGVYLATTSGGDNNYQLYDQSGSYLSTSGQFVGVDGMVTKVNAGVCDDTTFTADTNGNICIDSTNGRLYFRYGGAWHYVSQTAGFQIPNYETAPQSELNKLAKDEQGNALPFDGSNHPEYIASRLQPGDFLMPYVDEYLSDGAVHGLYAKFSDVKGTLLAEEKTQIADLALKTDQNVTTLSGLQSSIDSQLLIASHGFDALALSDTAQNAAILALQTANIAQDATIATLQAGIETQASAVTTVQTQLTDMQVQLATLMDFYGMFQLGNIVTKDANGDLDLLNGALRVAKITTEGLAIDTTSSQAPTIGTATLYPVAVDVKKSDGSDGSDGLDDVTEKSMLDADVLARDGKSLTVPTAAVSAGSRIFITPKTLMDEPFAVTHKNNGVDFSVSLKTAIVKPVEFDWLIVEEK